MQSITIINFAEALLIFIIYIVVLFILAKVLPGKLVFSPVIADGTKIKFKLNGFLSYLLVTLGLGFAGFFSPKILVFLYEKFWSLFLVANLFSFLLTAIFYFYYGEKYKNFFYFLKEFWHGSALHPEWLGVDLKMFSYRPSLIGLCLFNFGAMAYQYSLNEFVSIPMVIYQLMMYFYLASSFQFEKGMLSMWDILAEKFGFMLIWGDYAFFPFFYCIPGIYMASLHTTSGVLWIEILLSIVLFIFGFFLFRTANQQKNQFKSNPQAKIWHKPPKTIGNGQILISGWWGIGRKLNYTGEILLYFGMAMTTGFYSFVPYLLPIWMLVLLCHRAWRDDIRCKRKYGPLWAEYSGIAKFKMIPFIY